MKKLEYLWDKKVSIEECYKIPEDKASLIEIRKSSGMEIDLLSGIRNYLVLRPRKVL